MEQYPKYRFFMLLSIMSLTFIEVGCTFDHPVVNTEPPVAAPVPKSIPVTVPDKPETFSSGSFAFPLGSALDRITKKPFWLKVSPGHSPISPERFTGYHTGVDFETFSSEQNEDVVIRAICTGPLVLKKWATGYGGVAVQRCQLESQDITVVYGHLKFESIMVPIQSIIQPGQPLWILWKGFTHETDGERKHLHLAIHIWSTLDIRGYVATYGEINQWIDPMKYLSGK